MSHEVLIVGAGLAGLCCARALQKQGVDFLVLEAADGVGGRIRTDVVDGFRLDRGFQVFLTSYPEAKAVLDYDALDLKPFWPGALVRFRSKFHELADPWRRPFAAMKSVFSPIGSMADKLRVARLRARTLRGSIEDRFRDPETTSLQMLRDCGFSPSMIDRFFKPFLGGIFLDPELQTSSRMLSFLFRMFSMGDACLPADGMEAIPRQLASRLQPSSVRLNTRVVKVARDAVTLANGDILNGKFVVVAVDGFSAAGLLGEAPVEGKRTTCIYFAAKRSPAGKPLLVLNGDGRGPINNLCVATDAAPSYGPGDKALISVTVLGTGEDPAYLMTEVRQQLEEWFGPVVQEWQQLRTYSIPYALPAQTPPALSVPERPARLPSGIYVCGDHRDNASINEAMVSGRRTAEAILNGRK